MFQEWIHPSRDDQSQNITQPNANCRADHTLHQSFGKHYTEDGRAIRANRAQHANVVTALGDDFYELDEVAARASGIDTVRYKLAVFCISWERRAISW